MPVATFLPPPPRYPPPPRQYLATYAVLKLFSSVQFIQWSEYNLLRFLSHRVRDHLLYILVLNERIILTRKLI